jgi:uncharacterized repeat protein (TIGR01451 family)
MVLLAIGAIPLLAQDSISPTTFSASLAVGQSASVTKTVTVGQLLNPIDILFVVDTTGSMDPTIKAVASGFSGTVTAIAGFASNVQFGVGEYKDFFQCPTDPFAYQLDANLTSNTTTVQNALNGLSASGGCDDPESNLFGLQQGANTTSWRPGSTRIIVWVGDNAGHDPAGTATEATAIAALVANKVLVIAASANSGPGLDALCDSGPCGTPNGNQAMRIAAATSGSDLGIFDSTTIVSAIETAIKNAIAMYSSVGLGLSGAPAGVLVALPVPITGSFDRSTTRIFTFSPNVVFTGTVPGVYTFAINGLVNGATVASEADTIVVIGPPVINKSFSAAKIVPGGTATVTLAITNPNSFAALTGVAFTDSLPAGMTVASPANLTSTCGGVAVAGGSTISLSGGVIAASSTCAVTATITATEGIYVNSVSVTSANGGPGNTATANLSVATPPVLSKAFGEVAITPGSSVTLSFRLTNPNNTLTLDALMFADPLPAGLIVSTPNGLTGSCDGGTIGATPGSSLITLSGAGLPAGANCIFRVNVSSDGSVVGLVTNTTTTVTSTEALPGAAATAVVFIGNPFLVNYSANLNFGESFVDIGNAGTNGAPLLGPGLGGAVGNTCVNVYAFDPTEELISCCSCLVTPNQTVNLGVTADLTSKTLTGVQPTSVTIKLLATLAGGDGKATNCNNSAAAAPGTLAGALANGTTAYRTTLHATPVSGSFATSETPFTPSTLSAGELASIAGRCASIIGNASGFGICTSCRNGALGATKQQ